MRDERFGIGGHGVAWRRVAALALALAVIAALGLTALVRADSGSRGRLYNARLSSSPGGRAETTFAAGTRVIYLNFDYDGMSNHAMTVTIHDAAGNILHETTRRLFGRGTESVALNSLVVVDRLFDALDADDTSLLIAIDDALAHMSDPVARFRYIQNALSITNRMRGSAAALGGLPLSPESIAALDEVIDRLAQARSEGLAAVAETDAALVLPHLQAMRQHAVDLIVSLRSAREHSGLGGSPFPPSVDCQPYVTNVVIDGTLRQSLEFAIGDPGEVADIQLRPGRFMLLPGVRGMDGTAVIADLVDLACAPVRDGTPVTFEVIPAESAAVAPESTTTSGGSVTAYVRVSGPGGGTVLLVARAGHARAVIVFRLGLPPRAVRLSAAHATLVAGQSTTLTAYVEDANGRPVADGTSVVFEVDPSSRGAAVPAGAVTTRGVATTAFTAGPQDGQVRITADVAGVKSGVTILVVPPPTPSATAPPAPTSTPVPGPGPTEPPRPTAAPNTERPGCAGQEAGALCDASLVVQVYRDDTCDRRFDRVWDRNLADVPVTIAFANGHQETARTSSSGVVLFGGLNLPPGQAMEVFVTLPTGATMCYNSPARLTLREPDFRPSRYERVTFRTR